MIHKLWVALALSSAGAVWAADSAQDKAMLRLAADSGCTACHRIESGAKGSEGASLIGPAWMDVSTRYRGQGDAAERLTNTVMSGSNPNETHWRVHASGVVMPSNAVAIKEADAKALVRWILALGSHS